MKCKVIPLNKHLLNPGILYWVQSIVYYSPAYSTIFTVCSVECQVLPVEDRGTWGESLHRSSQAQHTRRRLNTVQSIWCRVNSLQCIMYSVYCVVYILLYSLAQGGDCTLIQCLLYSVCVQYMYSKVMQSTHGRCREA